MKHLPLLASLGILALAGMVLARELAAVNVEQVLAQLASIPLSTLLLATAFTGAALLMLALYEIQMLRYLRGGPGWRRSFLAALVAYPIGHVVGFGAVSGGAVRYRVYAPAGLHAAQLPKLMLLSVMPYATALGLIGGLVLLLAGSTVAPLLRIELGAARALGVLLLGLHLAWVLLVLHRKRPLSLWRWQLELPGPRLIGYQYLYGVAEVLCAAAVLYCLLPAGAVPDYLPFLAIYVAAMGSGVASGVPAGLGVFESVLLLTLPDIPAGQLIGAVLAYRLIYQLLPLAAALILLLAFEAWSPGAARRR